MYGGTGDNLEAKNIHELINEFKQSSDTLQSSMKTFTEGMNEEGSSKKKTLKVKGTSLKLAKGTSLF